MVKLIQEVLDSILDQHMDWLNNKPGGVRAKLNNVDLNGLTIKNRSLQFAELRGTSFDKTTLINVNFNNSDLCDGIFIGSEIIGCRFEYTNLSRTDFSESKINDTNFRNSNIMGAKFKETEIKMATISFCDLLGTTMSNSKIQSSNFENSNCRQVDFSGANIINSALIKCELSFSTMVDTKIEHTKLYDLHTNGIEGQDIINVMVNLGKKQINLTYWKDLEIWTQGYLQGNLNDLRMFLELACSNEELLTPIYNEVLELILNLSNNYNSTNGERIILNNILNSLDNRVDNKDSNNTLNWDI